MTNVHVLYIWQRLRNFFEDIVKYVWCRKLEVLLLKLVITHHPMMTPPNQSQLSSTQPASLVGRCDHSKSSTYTEDPQFSVSDEVPNMFRTRVTGDCGLLVQLNCGHARGQLTADFARHAVVTPLPSWVESDRALWSLKPCIITTNSYTRYKTWKKIKNTHIIKLCATSK